MSMVIIISFEKMLSYTHMGAKQDRRDKVDNARTEVFAEVYARTNSPKQAMIAAQPSIEATPHYASIKASRMLQRTDVQDKIQHKLERMSVKAIKNIDSLMTSDDEQIKLKSNIWVAEQVRGKAVTRSINLNASASIEDALFDDA